MSDSAAPLPHTDAADAKNRRVLVFYHYLYPDNVVSAIHMDELCQGLVTRGWEVTGFPGNRGCRDESLTYPPFTVHKGVTIRRLWRPRLLQASSAGRILNALWMILRWSLLAFKPNPPAAVVVGTDPILSVLTAICWKLVRPQTVFVHWAFDLYPEAAYADGVLSPGGAVASLLEKLLRRAYAACDAILDIGPCMRQRLARYGSPARTATIVPWALEEPEAVLPVSQDERERIFGDAHLAMLYSGNFGRAHTYEDFLALSRTLAQQNAMMAFSVRGNREEELRHALQAEKPGDTCRLALVPFAPATRLLDRLAAPDIHLLSLASAWTGLVVPSKFFGAIAAGRPVLYSGSHDSSVAQWIRQYDLGWVLTAESLASVAADLLAYIADPARIDAMRERCRSVYQAQFSREASLNSIASMLDELVFRHSA